MNEDTPEPFESRLPKIKSIPMPLIKAFQSDDASNQDYYEMHSKSELPPIPILIPTATAHLASTDMHERPFKPSAGDAEEMKGFIEPLNECETLEETCQKGRKAIDSMRADRVAIEEGTSAMREALRTFAMKQRIADDTAHHAKQNSIADLQRQLAEARNGQHMAEHRIAISDFEVGFWKGEWDKQTERLNTAHTTLLALIAASALTLASLAWIAWR